MTTARHNAALDARRLLPAALLGVALAACASGKHAHHDQPPPASPPPNAPSAPPDAVPALATTAGEAQPEVPAAAEAPPQRDQAAEPSHRHQHKHRHHRSHRRFRNAKAWSRIFESRERDAWQRPDAVLKLLQITPTMKIVDIGAATGYFAVRLARAVPEGRVWALDIEPDMVRYLKRRAQRERLPQLEARLAKAKDPEIPAPVDLVFLCNTYHHIADRTAYFTRVGDALEPSSRLVIVDFKLGPIPVGPPEHHRVSVEQIDRELRAAGYRRASLDTTTLPYQYIAIYQR